MRYGSVCSGIEAATSAWHTLGWTPSWFAEIEPFPSAVLAHHYPDVANLGDMTKIKQMILDGEIEAPDVFVGGTPCQAFSVAGLRKSLEDDRGQLSVTYIHTLDAIDIVRSVRGEKPCIAVWENVPGVLSTTDNAFGCFLAGMAGFDEALKSSDGKWKTSGVVYGPKRTVAWRVLDAQYFGVAQRRRRVFVVAGSGEFDPSKVLFESEGLRRDIAPSREKGQRVAPTVTNGPPFSRTGNERVECEAMIATYSCQAIGEYRSSSAPLKASGSDLGKGCESLVSWPATVAPTLNAAFGEKQGLEDQHINGGGACLCLATGQANAELTEDICVTLNCNHEAPIVCRS